MLKFICFNFIIFATHFIANGINVTNVLMRQKCRIHVSQLRKRPIC